MAPYINIRRMTNVSTLTAFVTLLAALTLAIEAAALPATLSTADTVLTLTTTFTPNTALTATLALDATLNPISTATHIYTLYKVPTATRTPNVADVRRCNDLCRRGAKKYYPIDKPEDCNLAHGDWDDLPCAQNKCQADCSKNVLFWYQKMCKLEYPKLTARQCNAKIGFMDFDG